MRTGLPAENGQSRFLQRSSVASRKFMMKDDAVASPSQREGEATASSFTRLTTQPAAVFGTHAM